MVDLGTWLHTIRSEAPPLRVPRRGAIGDALLEEHVRAAVCDPESHALIAIAAGATPSQQLRALIALLSASRANASPDACAVADRVIAVLVAHLPDATVLRSFLALRRLRRNHKHATRAFARWLFLHPDAEHVIASHRVALVDVFEHAFGRNVARACIEHVATPTPDGATYLARNLHRVVRGERVRTEALVALLARGTNTTTLARVPAQVASTNDGDAPAYAIPKTVTATNRGDIAATLVHIYRGGDSPVLRRGLEDYVDAAAARLPSLPGRVALVVDASLSTLGYGERRYCCISQSWALRLVLARCCADLSVHLAGGRADPPEPEGATDLVTPLLDALDAKPDVVAIVSDGYENRLGGELAAVLEALPRAGVTTPIVFIASKFTHKDDLSLRSPAPAAHQVDVWHEADFATVVETIGTLGAAGRTFLHNTLAERLSALERSRPSWIPHSHTSR
jgi:hypothetical protein